MLKVPFSQKDAAKVMGARWDPKAKSWYAPAGLEPEARDALLDRWGENAGDAGMGTLELVNALARCTDGLLPGEATVGDPVRVEVPPVAVKVNAVVVEWPLLRRHVSGRRGGACEGCGCAEPEKLLVQPLWEYDDARRVQTLAALAALCPDCFAAAGRARRAAPGAGDVYSDPETAAALHRWVARIAPLGDAAPLEDGGDGPAPRWRADLSLLTGAGFAVQGLEPPH